MRGQSNKLAPSLDVQPLYRGTLNSFCAISEEGLIKNNKANPQALANTTLGSATPDGMIAGSVAQIVGPGLVGPAGTVEAPALPPTDGVIPGLVGIVQRNAAGEAFESTSSVASGSITYIHGSTTLVEVPVYETHNVAGDTALDYSAAAGQPVYASQNGLLTIAAGLSAVGAGATEVGVLVAPPTASSPLMAVQLRV